MFNKSPEKCGREIQRLITSANYDRYRDGAKIAKLLWKQPVFEARSGENHILSHAIYHAHDELVDYCLKHKVGIDLRGRYREVVLETAINKSNSVLARKIIAAGADVHVTDAYHSKTFLMQALARGDLPTARALIKKGLSLEDITEYGYGAVVAAIDSGDIKVLDFALKGGAPLSVRDLHGRSPISLAVYNDNLEMLNMLLQAGAVPDFSSRLGNRKSLMTLAKEASIQVQTRIRELKAAQDAEKTLQMNEKKSLRHGWHLVSQHEVAVVTPPQGLPYQVTEIFNFVTGIYTRINCNTKTGAESSSMLDFSQISNTTMIEDASAELTRLGGGMPDGGAALVKKRLIS